MNKYAGLTRKKQEERAAKNKDGVGAMIASIAGQTQKFIHEWSEKHNQLAKLVDSVFRIATTEVGKIWANEQRLVESLDHVDINVLAVAELNRDVYARFAKYDALLEKLREMAELPLPEGEAADAIELAGKGLYTEAIKAAFAAVLERRKQEDEEKKAAMEKAAADAKAAEEAKTEAEKAEAALMAAEKEVVTDATAGGPGVDIPEGATVFGGV